MARGIRLLPPETEQAILRDIALRDALTDKALAQQYGLTLWSFRWLITRLRRREREAQDGWLEHKSR